MFALVFMLIWLSVSSRPIYGCICVLVAVVAFLFGTVCCMLVHAGVGARLCCDCVSGWRTERPIDVEFRLLRRHRSAFDTFLHVRVCARVYAYKSMLRKTEFD